tara:strand:+ start:240 stop:629 length:390 start_codon:yes stop_codon:yes gene_type:complete
MALNTKHIKDHRGKQEYNGEEASNIVLGQSGVDILVAQNDLMTAGGGYTIGGSTDADGMANVKGWSSITALGNSTATTVTCNIKLKTGSITYTDISLQLPVGITIYGAFYYIKHTDTVSNGEALYCVRG